MKTLIHFCFNKKQIKKNLNKLKYKEYIYLI